MQKIQLETYNELTDIINKQNKIIEELTIKVVEQDNLIQELFLKGETETFYSHF